jgi:hypothetical protein
VGRRKENPFILLFLLSTLLWDDPCMVEKKKEEGERGMEEKKVEKATTVQGKALNAKKQKYPPVNLKKLK